MWVILEIILTKYRQCEDRFTTGRIIWTVTPGVSPFTLLPGYISKGVIQHNINLIFFLIAADRWTELHQPIKPSLYHGVHKTPLESTLDKVWPMNFVKLIKLSVRHGAEYHFSLISIQRSLYSQFACRTASWWFVTYRERRRRLQQCYGTIEFNNWIPILFIQSYRMDSTCPT